MSVPRENATTGQRLKALEQEVARLRLQASSTVATVAPTDVMPRSTWIDPSANNAPYFLDDAGNWIPTRDGTIAVAQATASGALTAATTDGLPPSASPTPVASGVISGVRLTWDAVVNRDPVQFRLYGSTATGFTPGAGNLITTTPNTSFTHVPSPVNYTATYYYRLVEFDADGAAGASPEVSAQPVQVNTPDMAVSYIYAGTMAVDKLSGGSLAADVLLAATMRTGLTGARVELGPFGIVIYDPSGSPTTVLPSDGTTSTFKGDAEVGGLTVTGGMSLRSTGAHEISQSAALTLAGQVTPPQAAPTAVIDYESSVMNEPGLYGSFYQSGLFYGVDSSGNISSWAYPYTGATVYGGLVGPSHPHDGGIVKIGTSWYTLGLDSGTNTLKINKYADAPGAIAALQTSVTYTPLSSSSRACIGVDDTGAFLIADFNPATNVIRVQQGNATTLALSTVFTTATTAAFAGSSRPIYVQAGFFDAGVNRYYVGMQGVAKCFAFGSPTAYIPNESFQLPLTGATGMGWDGTRFYTVYSNPNLNIPHGTQYKHTTDKWVGADPATWYSAATWRDTNATGGTHETSMSPVGTIAMKRRARLTLTSPAIPAAGVDDPNAVSFYLSNTTNARTSLFQQTLPADGVKTLVLTDTLAFTGTNPPLTNNFPTVATPGRIRNPNDTLVISGDGSITAAAMSLGTTPVSALTQCLSAACTANLALQTVEADITGATVTFTTARANARYLVMGSFYFSSTAANNNVASGKLSVDGAVQTAFANFTGLNTTPDRMNAAQSWAGTLAAAGSHTLKLRGVHAAANNVVTVNSGSTTITVLVFE